MEKIEKQVEKKVQGQTQGEYDILTFLKDSEVTMTFSKWCCSGLVPKYAERCECSRCRTQRGEKVTAESEALSEEISKRSRQAFYDNTDKFLKESRERREKGVNKQTPNPMMALVFEFENRQVLHRKAPKNSNDVAFWKKWIKEGGLKHFKIVEVPKQATKGIFNDNYECKKSWDWDCEVQAGERGIVFNRNGKGSYITSFFEAFPNSPYTFVRGEGETIEEAEEQAWDKLQKIIQCPKHEFKAYGKNNVEYCKKCGMYKAICPPME